MHCTPIEKLQARKPHRCMSCGEVIAAGETYYRWRSYDGGDAVTNKMHPEYLDDASWAKAVELGNGNASDGIRMALARAAGDRHPIPIPPADFKKRMETWTKVIQGGKKTADDIIAALATKRWAPSKEQEAEIRAIKKGEQQ